MDKFLSKEEELENDLPVDFDEGLEYPELEEEPDEGFPYDEELDLGAYVLVLDAPGFEYPYEDVFLELFEVVDFLVELNNPKKPPPLRLPHTLLLGLLDLLKDLEPKLLFPKLLLPASAD